MSFEQLGLIEPILKALKKEQYTTPTPIQAKAIPEALKGKDILGLAQTGTGKTAAFAIPVLQQLAATPLSKGYRHTRTLILTPTRELAVQISESFESYGRFLGLKHEVIFGRCSRAATLGAWRTSRRTSIRHKPRCTSCSTKSAMPLSASAWDVRNSLLASRT